MSKAIAAAIAAGFVFAVAVPAFAADAPTTKADCKMADMKWDSKAAA